MITAVSYLLRGQWRRRVSLWKALIELYRLGVQSASLDDFCSIDPVKNRSRKPPTAWKSTSVARISKERSKQSNLTIWPPLESSSQALSFHTIIAVKTNKHSSAEALAIYRRRGRMWSRKLARRKSKKATTVDRRYHDNKRCSSSLRSHSQMQWRKISAVNEFRCSAFKRFAEERPL